MPAGSLQNVLYCKPGYATTQNPCPTGSRYAVMQAYVIDPAAQQYLDPVVEPFDYVKAGEFWAYGFTFVLSLYLFSHAVGLILKKVRDD